MNDAQYGNGVGGRVRSQIMPAGQSATVAAASSMAPSTALRAY
ncbi:MAG: hypothetical protein ABIW79_02825 [Gemmatimonas sp.]